MDSWQAVLNELNAGDLEIQMGRRYVMAKIEANEPFPGEMQAKIEVLDAMNA